MAARAAATGPVNEKLVNDHPRQQINTGMTRVFYLSNADDSIARRDQP